MMYIMTRKGVFRGDTVLFLMPMSDEERSKLESIYDVHANFMYRASLKYMGDEHLARDCMQQSLERLIKYLDRLDAADSPQTKSYVYKTVVSTAKNMKRSDRKYVTESDEVLLYHIDRNCDRDEIEKFLAEAESREALKQAEANLSWEEKLLLSERYGRERSYAEISEFLGISEVACRKRVQRTKEHLAELLGWKKNQQQDG